MKVKRIWGSSWESLSPMQKTWVRFQSWLFMHLFPGIASNYQHYFNAWLEHITHCTCECPKHPRGIDKTV